MNRDGVGEEGLECCLKRIKIFLGLNIKGAKKGVDREPLDRGYTYLPTYPGQSEVSEPELHVVI